MIGLLVQLMLRVFIFCLLLGGGFSVFAQKLTDTERAVYALMESGFLDAYKDYRSETETHVALFKSRQDSFTTADLIRMKASYRRTAEAFEDFIYGVRNDLLDKKKRKEIRKHSEAYVTASLAKLNQTYAAYFGNRFYPLYSSITEAPLDYAANRSPNFPVVPIAVIAPVTKATMEIIEYIDKKGDRNLEHIKKVLEKEWVKPHQFREWEDI